MKKTIADDLDFTQIVLDPHYLSDVAIPYVKTLDKNPENILLLGYGLGFVSYGIVAHLTSDKTKEMYNKNLSFIMDVFTRILSGKDITLIIQKGGKDSNDNA